VHRHGGLQLETNLCKMNSFSGVTLYFLLILECVILKSIVRFKKVCFSALKNSTVFHIYLSKILIL
jgi:hypothetical protein